MPDTVRRRNARSLKKLIEYGLLMQDENSRSRSSPRWRVTLTVPPYGPVEQPQYRGIPQLGVGYLASSLLAAGHACSVVDSKMSMLDLRRLVDRLVATRPDVVGISAMTDEIGRAHQVAEVVKKRLPNVFIVVGGCHATALALQTLQEFPAFDAAVAGEGERVLPEMVERLRRAGPASLDGLKGVAWRNGCTPVFNGPMDRMLEDLDALPVPAWQLFPTTRIYPLITSRGCPFRCVFCQRAMGERVRFRSADSVLEELTMVVERFHANDVRVRDETFALSKIRVHEICEGIRRRGLNKKFHWWAQSHCNVVDRVILREMREAGCRTIGFGIESGNEGILASMGKNTTKDRIRRAIADAKAVGLRVGTYFILGHPGETRATIEDTIRFAAELNADEVSFARMVPFPGTEVYRMALRGEGGYRNLAQDWSQFGKYLANPVVLDGLSSYELDRAQLRAYSTFFARNRRITSALRFALLHRRAAIRAFRTWGGRILSRQ